MRGVISWGERFSAVLHGIFMPIFLEGHLREKKTLTSSNLQIVPDTFHGTPPPPPPPLPSPTKRLRSSMISAALLGNLSISDLKIFSGNIQHSYLYLFCFLKQNSVKKYKSAVTRSLSSRSESAKFNRNKRPSGPPT